MAIFNLGGALGSLSVMMTVNQFTEQYDRGRLKVDPDTTFVIKGSIQDKPQNSRQQFYEENADRLQKTKVLFTASSRLELTRKSVHRSEVVYRGETYKVVKKGDWDDYKYYSYELELVIPVGG